MRFRRNDLVVVTAGAHKGKQGRIIRIDEERNAVYVGGLNLRYKHMRRSQKYPQGGRVQKEAPIHASNVQLVDPKHNRPTRVGYRRDEQGRKVRYAKRSGEPV